MRSTPTPPKAMTWTAWSPTQRAGTLTERSPKPDAVWPRPRPAKDEPRSMGGVPIERSPTPSPGPALRSKDSNAPPRPSQYTSHSVKRVRTRFALPTNVNAFTTPFAWRPTMPNPPLHGYSVLTTHGPTTRHAPCSARRLPHRPISRSSAMNSTFDSTNSRHRDVLGPSVVSALNSPPPRPSTRGQNSPSFSRSSATADHPGIIPPCQEVWSQLATSANTESPAQESASCRRETEGNFRVRRAPRLPSA